MQTVLHDQLEIQLWIESLTLTMHARLIGGDPLRRVAASWSWPRTDHPPSKWAASEIADEAIHALGDESDLPISRPRLIGQTMQALAAELLDPGRPRIALTSPALLDEHTARDFPELVAEIQGLAAAGAPCRVTEEIGGPVVEILGWGWAPPTLVAITGLRGWCDWERYEEIRDPTLGVPVTRLSGLRRTAEPGDDAPDYLRDDPTARASILIALEFHGAPFSPDRASEPGRVGYEGSEQ